MARLTAVLEAGLRAGPPLFLCVLFLQASLLSRNIQLAKVLAMLKHCFPHHQTTVTVNSLVICLYLCAGAGMGVEVRVSSANER